ncbi:MAG TPA: bifunctional 5,10-methylenetetrahydrofolate dehydrogenase/5,10-methenyltetrahydrofolate cyclohydrolase [Acidimicrobiia bacterium]|nr:bifunctional 5,10-methylenetetrahydrofolate dehydrogenase/5,10-methenyltetrahydrofolate cyclohydrolase [Acidimicrobiia bacterium]
MTARILSGKEAAAALRAEIAGRVGALAADGKRVGLATLLVGDDPASAVYVRNKHKAAEAAGMRSFDIRLPADAAQQEVEEAVAGLNRDDSVDGYIVQLPLPGHLDPGAVLAGMDPRKDADGLHPVNLGRMVLEVPAPRPATPTGILRLLDHYEIPTRGMRAVVVGRSTLVGRPLSVMLGSRGRDATVTVAHTGTADLAAVTSRADLLFVAAGRPGLITGSHVKPGAFVVDAGINHVDGHLVGDTVFGEVADVAAGVTPVPGGVGPMTIAGLLYNTLLLAEPADSSAL